MINNENVYAGAEIVNENINELVISDFACIIIFVLILCIIYSMFIYRKLKKTEKRLERLESKFND